MNSPPWLDQMEPLLHAVLPRRCAGCDQVGRLWCQACSASLRSRRAGLVPPPLGAPTLLAVAGEHRELLRSAVLLHKSRHHGGVCGDLIFLAAQALALIRMVLPAVMGRARTPGADVALVPVPPSARRAWRSPAGEVAAGVAAGAIGVRYAPILRSRRRRQAQKSLDAAARARNMTGAFGAAVRPDMPTGIAVLIDDVVTTGATLTEARSVVESVGFTVPAAVALTQTPGPGR